MISIIFLSTLLPYLPTLPTIIANAAMIIPPDSTVDEDVVLTLTPSLDGKTYWHYDGLTTVVDQDTGSTLGKVRRYRSTDGSMTRLMVSGELAANEWVQALSESPDSVFRELEDNYTYYWFQPPAPKQGFGQFKFSDLLDVAGYVYSTSGTTLYISQTQSPKVTKFQIADQPTIDGCYRANSSITIQFDIEEYMPNSNKLHNIEIYGRWEGQPNPFLIYTKGEAYSSGGKFSDSATLKLPETAGKLELFMRAYDGAYRVDQESKKQNISLSVARPVAQYETICTKFQMLEDDESIPMFDFTYGTLLKTNGLTPGLAGRQNKMMGNFPDGKISWFGPLRYPTIYHGHVDDGGQLAPGVNEEFKAEGRSSQLETIKAYKMPFMYILSPVDINYAKPYGKVHPSETTETFNVQHVSFFDESDIEQMYNGNPTYVLSQTPKHTIETYTGKVLGEYYYIRDLADYSGADVSNSCDELNETCLHIYRTDYPDITSFKLRSSNDYSAPNKPIFMDFSGFEYVANNRFGEVRNWVDYKLEVIEGPSIVGQKVEGRISTNKSVNNAQKPHMNRYDGNFISPTPLTKVTPTAEGTYKVQLTITDAVMRSTTSTLTFTIGPNGGPGDSDGDYGSCEVSITTNATQTIQSAPSDMNIDPIGEINEDDSSPSNIFDVMNYSIPTDEYLDVYGETKRYLMDYKFQKYEGTITYTISVDRNYSLYWETSYSCGTKEEPDKKCWKPNSASDYKKLTFKDTYNYSFWQIGHLVFYEFNNFGFNNYALPNQSVTVVNNDHKTAVDAVHSAIWKDHVKVKACNNVTLSSRTVNLGKSDRKPSAGVDYFTSSEQKEFEQAAKRHTRQPDVTNDYVKLTTTSNRSYTRGGVYMSSKNISLSNHSDIYMTNQKASCSGPTDPLNSGAMNCFTTDAKKIVESDIVDLYQNNYYIDAQKVNNYRTRSTITANYRLLTAVNKSPSSTQSFTNSSDNNKINTVTVHTPIVMYARSSDDKEHDQRTNPPLRSTPANPNTDRHAYVLDRPFTVWLPTNGQHLNYPGYGNRDYTKYYKNKQVKFPFDVYSENKQAFYPANTWINVPRDIQSVTFYLPVWVPEGQYTVDFRAFAINYPGNTYPYTITEGGQQHEANLTIPNSSFYVSPAGYNSAAHTVYDSIEVDVVGRLYDFRITDITDYNWQSAFRSSDGITANGNSYWVGTKGIDGAPRGNSSLFTLPVRQGSHPEGYKNLAVKTGYTFRFDLKTKGNMFNAGDGIRIKPTFYFVNKDGTNRQEVDLYYHNGDNYFVKVGSPEDTVYREVKLNEPLRNVPLQELTANADYYYRHATEYGMEDITSKYYHTSYIRHYVKHASKEDVLTGPYGWQILNWKLRTFRGPEENEVPSNTMVPTEDIVAREQTWYGEYSIPAKVYAVTKGTEISRVSERLDENNPIFLRDGYIIVNFDIETIRNGDLNNPYLQYINGRYMNQWYDMEGFSRSITDPYGYTFELKDGDVIFYHGDASSEDDFNASVTH